MKGLIVTAFVAEGFLLPAAAADTHASVSVVGDTGNCDDKPGQLARVPLIT